MKLEWAPNDVFVIPPWKRYTHHASDDDPQYEIKSDKSDHVAAHKGGALRLLR